MTTLNAHDYTVGEILTAATMDGVTSDLNTLLTEVEGSCYIETGTYTGDGTTGQTVNLTDTELVIKALWIWRNDVDGGTAPIYFTSDTFCDNDVDGLAVLIANPNTADVLDHRVASVGTGSFEVDDDSANANPNTDTTVFNYLAIGTH